MEYLELLKNTHIAFLCGMLIIVGLILAIVVSIVFTVIRLAQIRADLVLSLTKDGKSMQEIEHLLVLHKNPYAPDQLAMWTFGKVYSRYSGNTDDAIAAVKALRSKT